MILLLDSEDMITTKNATPKRMIITKNLALSLTSGILLNFLSTANADILATWVSQSNGVGGNQNNAPFNYSAPAVPGVQSAVLSLPGTVLPGSALERVSANNYGFSATSQPTRGLANSEGHFFQFEINAEPGLLLNLTSLDATFQNGGGNFESFNRAQVRSSINNFGPRIGSTITGNDLDLNGFDLSGSEFQGINSVTFRIYFWEGGVGNAGSNNSIRLQGNKGVLTINGAVVPEISSALPLGMLLGFSVIGRRKRKS